MNFGRVTAPTISPLLVWYATLVATYPGPRPGDVVNQAPVTVLERQSPPIVG